MSWGHTNWVSDHSKVQNPYALVILLTLARLAKKDTGHCFLDDKTLAQKCRMSHDSIQKYLKTIPLDELKVKRGGSLRGQKRTITDYWVLNTLDAEDKMFKNPADRTPIACSQACENDDDRTPIASDHTPIACSTVRQWRNDRTPIACLKEETNNNKEVKELTRVHACEEVIQQEASHDHSPGPTSIAADGRKTVTKEEAYEAGPRPKQIPPLPSEEAMPGPKARKNKKAGQGKQRKASKGSLHTNPALRPTREAFVEYARSKGISTDLAGKQWDIWDADRWKDGKGNEIYSYPGKLITFADKGFGAFQQNGQSKKRDWDQFENRKKLCESYKPSHVLGVE